ncbi:MAG: hypothetical protein R6T92_13795 [Desulfosalsimonadaceae bacterium]
MEASFFVNQMIKWSLMGLVSYFCGLLAVYKAVKVNYTRKIVHFSIFLIPIYLDQVLVFERTLTVSLISSFAGIAILLVYMESLRERVSFFQMMFNAIDRPEDRPHTLLWLFTQTLVAYLVVVPCIYIFIMYDMRGLIMIPLLITAIGDGLAEPVGVRFGRHKYRVSALTTNRVYYRSLEGSSCVFIASLVIVGAHHAHFSTTQFIAAMVVMPVVMTLTEAFSPHTWDTPTLFLAGYLVLFGVAFI